MRLRLLPLALTTLLAFSPVLTGPAAASPAAGAPGGSGRSAGSPQLHRLVLSPAQASIRAGASQAYTATGYDAAGRSLGDLTDRTSFSIRPDGSCAAASCTATSRGRHTVTGTVDLGHRGISGTADLEVLVPPAPADPAPAPAGPSGAPVGPSGAPAGPVPGPGASARRAVAPRRGPVAPPRGPAERSRAPVAPTRRQVGWPQPLTGLELLPGRAFIPSGGSLHYFARLVAADGTRQDVTGRTAFSIRFTAAKTSRRIRPDGSCAGAVCTATKLGRHTVTGTLDLGDRTLSGTAALQVVPRFRRTGRPQPLARLVLFPTEATVPAGEPVLFRAEGYDAAGHDLGDFTADTVFSVTPSDSCTITAAQVSCTTAGWYTVTGTVDLGDRTVSGTAILHVVPGPLVTLTLDPPTARVPAGRPQGYRAFGYDPYGNLIGELSADATFTVNPPGSCTITAAQVTCTRAGAYKVTGTVHVGDRAVSGTAVLEVVPGPLAHLRLHPIDATVEAGRHQDYQAFGYDAYWNFIGELGADATFTVNPPGSCTITAAQVTCTMARLYRVTAIIDGISGTASLHVVTGPLDHLALDPSDVTVEAGQPQDYRVVASTGTTTPAVS